MLTGRQMDKYGIPIMPTCQAVSLYTRVDRCLRIIPSSRLLFDLITMGERGGVPYTLVLP